MTLQLLENVTTLVDATTTTTDWTDLDLSSYLTSGARCAYLQVRIRQALEETDVDVGIRVHLREKGESGSSHEVTVSAVTPPTGPGVAVRVVVDTAVWVPVDASGRCQYKIDYQGVEPVTWYVDIIYLGSIAIT